MASAVLKSALLPDKVISPSPRINSIGFLSFTEWTNKTHFLAVKSIWTVRSLCWNSFAALGCFTMMISDHLLSALKLSMVILTSSVFPWSGVWPGEVCKCLENQAQSGTPANSQTTRMQFSLYFHGCNSHLKNHPTTSGSPSDWFHTRFSAHQSTEPPRPFRRCFQVELHGFGEVQPASYWIQPLVSHCFWTSCWIVGSFCTQWINSQSQLGDENLQIGSPLICAWNKCPNARVSRCWENIHAVTGIISAAQISVYI